MAKSTDTDVAALRKEARAMRSSIDTALLIIDATIIAQGGRPSVLVDALLDVRCALRPR